MRKLASIRTIDHIEPISGADRIELAVVDGWKCVIKKGDFKPGDTVIYCEIDSFLPIREEFEFLRKSSYKKMGEEEGFRLRTIKLRGQISQGLLLPTAMLSDEFEIGDDVTEQLGIEKYEPPVPANLTGEVVGAFPIEIKKTDEERIQNLAGDFESFVGKTFSVSEKLDGTSLTVFFDGERVGVCGRNWEYAEDDTNTYWTSVKQKSIPEKLTELGRRLAIQGELVGPKIQGNRYRLKEPTLFAFNIFDLDEYGYVPKSEFSELCEFFGIESVPDIPDLEVPESIDEILVLAEGKSVLNPEAEREGLVWVWGSGRERISFKTISNRFLEKE